MARVADGDHTAMQALLDRYWSRLVLYAASILGSDDGAKDVVQQAFINVWEHRAAWQPKGPVRAYLYRVTRNVALNDVRAARTRRAREEDALGAHPTQSFATAGEALDRIHLRSEVERAIAALSERRQEVFRLSRFHGLSYAEIAEALQTSPQTVANQMSSALAELRLALSHLLQDD